MFYRKVITALREWAAEQDRKPLVLKGARQVGKTTAVDIFSKDFDHNLNIKWNLSSGFVNFFYRYINWITFYNGLACKFMLKKIAISRQHS